MNKLEFLGRGSGYNTKEENTAAYLRKNETLLLIDCGETAFRRVVEKDKIKMFLKFTGLKEGNLIYHDTCLNYSEKNVHTSLRLLSDNIPKEYRKQVYCMHIDGEDFDLKAKEKGFNVAHIV